ncbi:RDD family protein [Lacicoccus qingdaonensis]|uniref:RDD family protein n=1 Tax=Lacicoccus qingdaonensis TaxID=576118 RepID=UPI0015A4DF38|nr:RDD family protein [Salinicoccus qingdaonensis]
MKKRFLALLIDYIVIWIYLILLFLLFAAIYILFFDSIPAFDETTSHLMSLFTTVLPATLVFSYMEYRYPYQTFGKRRMGLEVTYESPSYWYSLLRNAMKFLPWHIGHTGVIRAMYNDYSVLWFMVGNIGFLLAVIYILMVLFGKHFKHIPDMIAGKSVRERGIKINET